MFEKLLKKLFKTPPPQVNDAPSVYETAFRNTPTIETSEVPGTQQSPLHKANTSESPADSPQRTIKVDINSLDRREFLFYDYLLGPSQSSCTLNPLEQFILTRVNFALKKPQAVLAHVPVLPKSVVRLTRLLNDPDFNLMEFISIVEKEPSVASEIVKVANSANYNHSGKEITNLKQAFMLLGAKDVKHHVLAHFVKDMCKVSPVYFRNFGEKIWQHSYDVATVAEQLAKSRNEDENAAYLIGLMHDLGKIVIFQFMVEAFKTMHPDYKQDSLVFKKFLSDKSMQLSVSLLKVWNMPKLIIEVVSEMAKTAPDSNRPSPLAQVLIDANLICELCVLKRDTEISDESFNTLLHSSNLAEDALTLLEDLIANESDSNTNALP